MGWGMWGQNLEGCTERYWKEKEQINTMTEECSPAQHPKSTSDHWYDEMKDVNHFRSCSS